MDEVNNYIKIINEHLDIIQSNLKKIKKLELSQQKTKIKEIKVKFETIENDMILFNNLLYNIDNSNKKEELEKIKDDFELKIYKLKNKKNKIEETYIKNNNNYKDGNNTKVNISEMDREQGIIYGNKKLDEINEIGDRVVDKVKDLNAQQNEINIELDRQINIVKKIGETNKDTFSLIKRSKNLISSFKKSFQTEKILYLFIILIIIGIIVVIILNSLGVKNKNINSVVLPN